MHTLSSPAGREVRRKIAGRLLLEGKSIGEVARIVKASKSSVKKWKDAVDRGGLDALNAKPHPGRKPRLNSKQKQQLVKLLLRGPLDAGYRTDLWTCDRVAAVVERKFGVRYHPGHVWKILRGLKWTCQKPEQRARERDELAVERWRREAWPRIKKGRRGASGRRFSR
jgi:transposase